VGTTQADFKVCRATPTAGSQERHVVINATGRTLVEKKTTGTCS
jgi:type IV fimbrial biogenesis protein FimT